MNSDSFRQNYNEFGVEGYYTQFGENYINPREEEVFSAISKSFTLWTTDFGFQFKLILPPTYLTNLCRKGLDLAAGSGEATEAVLKWASKNGKQVKMIGTDPFTCKFLLNRNSS